MNFENIIAIHCAPALAGIKCANLVSFSAKDYPQLEQTVKKYNKELNNSDIYFEILCQCNNRHLVLVYRKKLLSKNLSNLFNKVMLIKSGYPNGGMEELIGYLKKRLLINKDFPHEIGIFLGYPSQDVIGFCLYKGRNCKMCGYWKVYSNVEKAQCLFNRFDQCTNALCRKVSQGYTISELFSKRYKCG